MIRRSRSHTAPCQATSSVISGKPNTQPKSHKVISVNRSKSASWQPQLLITPTFTWDIPKTHKQIIYDDLGVKEMDSGGAVGMSCAMATKRAKISKQQNIKGSSAAEVKVHLVSPNQFKPLQEHIHDGHACSCKKQLLLEKSDDPFYTLSDEIMLGIFRWLPMTSLARCARVCKCWHHLVFDDTLWRRVDLSTKTFASGILGRVLQRGTVAAKLSRCSVQGSVFDEVSLESPGKKTRATTRASKHSKNTAESAPRPALHLQYVDLTASDTKPEQLVEILDRCPVNQIKKLSLESCAVNDDVTKCVANQGGSLEELNLCMCTGLTDEGLRMVLASCTKLESLNLGWTNLSPKELSVVVEFAPKSLEKLNLSGCRQRLRNDDLILLACRCSAMKELDLSDATVIGFSAVNAIVDHMTELHHIALSRCYSIPHLSLLQLGTMKNLRALDIFGLVQEAETLEMQELFPRVRINIYPFSAIARPTTTKKRNKIWEMVCYE